MSLKKVENSRSRKYKKWTKDEVELLKRLYHEKTLKEISEEVDHPLSSVRGKVYQLRLAKQENQGKRKLRRKKPRKLNDVEERREFFEALEISGIVEESNNKKHRDIPVIEEQNISRAWQEEKERAKRLRIGGGEINV